MGTSVVEESDGRSGISEVCGPLGVDECCDSEAACRFRALSRTATTLSTRRNRLRCRSLRGEERRHGIFLERS